MTDSISESPEDSGIESDRALAALKPDEISRRMLPLLDQLRASLGQSYRLDRELGGGGMSRVFLAWETALDRPVVIKVLPPEFAGAISVERFKREIAVAARLQHAHIVPLLTAGEADGVPWYSMPFVEGNSLRERLTEGALPLPDVVRTLRDIASALAYAHTRGIVHRDIKPENVLLGEGGAAVADFGVAKAIVDAGARGLATLTAVGVPLGTPGYMSPEQAIGDQHTDHRSDVYALGVVGYEMLTGHPPFDGRSPQATVAAHISEAPTPVERSRVDTPSGLALLVNRCLAKSPADRPQTASEIVAALEALPTPAGSGWLASPGDAPFSTPRARLSGEQKRESRPTRRGLVVATAALAVIAATATLWIRFSMPPAYALGHNAQVTLEPGLETSPALSPDGSVVAYLALSSRRTQLYTRSVAGGTAVELAPGLDCSPESPQWSPDGTRILFDCGGTIYVAPFPAGRPRVVVAKPDVLLTSAAWSPDGRRIVYVEDARRLVTQDPAQGEPMQIAEGRDLHSPAWSHDGRWIAAVSGNAMFTRRANFG